MVQSQQAAVQNALGTDHNKIGMCLMEVQSWYRIPPAQPDASAAWRAARLKHPRDRRPPRGAPVFWTGGRANHGHIAMALGDGTIRSTDAGGAGRMATVPLAWVEQHWSLRYEGWTGDLEGVAIPWLANGGIAAGGGGGGGRGSVASHGWDRGRVVVAKLRYGEADSDSVRRLQHALNQIRLPAPGNVTLPLHGNYDDQTDLVVRAWQRHVGNQPDPVKKSSIGPKQAHVLFGCPPYQLG